MKRLSQLISLALLLAILLGIRTTITLAQQEIVCEADVVVQADDWLSKIADKFYGDVLAYEAIANATNIKSTLDNTYARIDDVNVIEPGWKLCIPSVEGAEAILERVLAPRPEAAEAGQDTIIIAQGADAFSMDPTQHTVLPTAAILYHIYEPLIFRQADGSFAPGLAVSWAQEEPTRWRFQLRQGIQFTNGEPMNAEAVAFSINRAIDPATESPYRSRLSTIEGAQAVDEYTVDIFTTQPDPVLEHRLIQNSFASLIVPPKYVQENGGIIPDDAPVGTGPYKFQEWVKDDRVVMVDNEEYWGNDIFWSDVPKPKTLIWRPIPETATRIAALRNGEVDIAVNVSPELASSINESPDTSVMVAASDFLYFVVMNTETIEAFQNQQVRQALNYAVDKQAILENIMLGYGEPIAVTMTANGFGYPDNLQPYPYDPEKARAMLAEAGYPDGFDAGVFMSRNGRYLKDAEIVQTIAKYLEEVGVKTEVQFVEPGVWGDLGSAHARGDMNFPGWSGLDPDLVWYAILHCGQFQSYFCNEELDALLDAGRSTIDKNERAAIYQQAGEMIYDLAPHIPLFQPPLVYGVNSKLVWEPSGDDLINLRGVYFAQ
jgi:peptide/nickel transport system substrate-binding protein